MRHLPVAFIGNDLKERFFPNVDPIGKTIDVEGRPFEVIGTAKVKGSVFGQSQDNFVIIPVQTYFKIYGARNGMSYMAQAKDRAVLMQAQDEIRMLLRAYRHLGPKQDDNFAIISSDSLVSAWDQMTGAIAATAVAVVSVFMVVGGVVIMNIMLAVVTERTREIGIRKSVGARRQDILNQFLVESAMLAGVGRPDRRFSGLGCGGVGSQRDAGADAPAAVTRLCSESGSRRWSGCFLGFIRRGKRRNWIRSKH